MTDQTRKPTHPHSEPQSSDAPRGTAPTRPDDLNREGLGSPLDDRSDDREFADDRGVQGDHDHREFSGDRARDDRGRGGDGSRTDEDREDVVDGLGDPDRSER